MCIQCGCLSDPDGGALYCLVGYEHLGNVKASETKLPVWHSLHSSSQLEGFHPHQNKWATGSSVSPALFQAQGLLSLTYWNWKHVQEHRNLCLPIVFDPLLAARVKEASISEYGIPKYPDFYLDETDTGELIGLEYNLQLPDKIEDADNIKTVIPKLAEDEVLESGLDPGSQAQLKSLLSTTSTQTPQFPSQASTSDSQSTSSGTRTNRDEREDSPVTSCLSLPERQVFHG